jgi:hypothetical protein
VFSVLAAAGLLAAGLSACQVKAGKAAYVGDQTITENTVNTYIEPTAKPQDVGVVGAKTFATQELIKRVILNKLADGIGGIPSDQDLASLHDAALSSAFGSKVSGADADSQLREAVAQRGLKPSFDALFTRNVELSAAIGDYLQSATAEQQQQVQDAIDKISVKVNPRYGTWSTNNLQLDGQAVPGWLRNPA